MHWVFQAAAIMCLLKLLIKINPNFKKFMHVQRLVLSMINVLTNRVRFVDNIENSVRDNYFTDDLLNEKQDHIDVKDIFGKIYQTELSSLSSDFLI